MAAGDKEMLQALEEVTRRNVKTNIEYSKATREIVRELENQVKGLSNMVISQNIRIEEQIKQLSIVQAKIYQGGT